jgi:hypothetical protein
MKNVRNLAADLKEGDVPMQPDDPKACTKPWTVANATQ